MKVWVTGCLTLASHSKLTCEGVSGAGKEHDPLMSRQAAVRQASVRAFRSEHSRKRGRGEGRRDWGRGMLPAHQLCLCDSPMARPRPGESVLRPPSLGVRPAGPQ